MSESGPAKLEKFPTVGVHIVVATLCLGLYPISSAIRLVKFWRSQGPQQNFFR
ncbi:hypothetical protein [Vibrio diabolicus]|uniref:hypothetical protein n=1 Tax=Vibrio diabolicus TaxID=50719 RepID=UPI003B5A47C8